MQTALLAALILSSFDDPSSKPAVWIELGCPDEQAEWVLRVFQIAKNTDPATALANWKRATKGKRSLGKGTEAAIAAFNPAMARELAVFLGSHVAIDFDAKTGQPKWFLAVPKDDGTLGAFATSMALTDGAAEKPLAEAAVDRLGNKHDARLMARRGDGVVIGPTRESLSDGLDYLAMAPPKNLRLSKTWPSCEVRNEGLVRSSDIRVRRVGEALLALGMPRLVGEIDTAMGKLRFSILSKLSFVPAPASVDPKWMDDFPADSSVAFAATIDPREEAWGRRFKALDWLEKSDAANANRSPLRARIGVIGRVAGVDLEADVWPKLTEISGFMVGKASNPEYAAIELHVVDEASAVRLVDHVLPKLAKSIGLGEPKAGVPQGVTTLGETRGRNLWAAKTSARTIRIGWGDGAMPTAPGAKRSPRLRDSLEKIGIKPVALPEVYNRRGLAWPTRLGLLQGVSPLSQAFEKAEPIEWYGFYDSEFGGQSDHIVVDTISAVERFLELIPQEPLPETRK